MAASNGPGRGRLPSPENLTRKTPEDLLRTLNRFGIDPDVEGIYARGQRAYASVKRLVDSGVDPDDAAIERIQQTMQKEFEQNLRKMVKTGIRNYKMRDTAPSDKEMWMTSGRGSCPSCEARHGQIKTHAQWIARGLPGSVALLCGEECNCQLLPA